MAYKNSDGLRIETDEPSAVIEFLASRAFGGPLSSERYIQDLQSRSELAVGAPLTSSDPASAVSFLCAAGVIEKTT